MMGWAWFFGGVLVTLTGIVGGAAITAVVLWKRSTRGRMW